MNQVSIIDSVVEEAESIGNVRVWRISTLFDVIHCRWDRGDFGGVTALDSPNVEVVHFQCDDTVLAQIKAHPDYGDAAILSEEVI